MKLSSERFFLSLTFMDASANTIRYSFYGIVKPEYNDHPPDPKFLAVVDRCSLFRGRFML
jgi:hypothetical protein